MLKPFRSLGCKKDPPDLRDIPMGLVMPAIRLPEKTDHTVRMSPVRDQGNEGTCVAFASVVGVKEFQDKTEYKKTILLSPRFLYWLCKKNDGIPDEEGTFPRVAMKMLKNFGTSLESCWKYKAHQKDFPCAEAEKQALVYRIKAYARLITLTDMKRSIVINGPFLAGVMVFESWFSKKTQTRGVIPMPGAKEESLGGHAICVTGYDNKKGLFKFKNSWGRQWGDDGYGYLTFDYMRKYCLDAWSATDLITEVEALVARREEIIKRYA